MYEIRGIDELALVNFLEDRGQSLVTAWKFVDDLKRAGFKIYYEPRVWRGQRG